MTEAAEAMAAVGQDREFLRRMGAPSLTALRGLDAEELCVRYLAIAASLTGCVLAEAKLGVIDGDTATVRYSLTAPRLGNRLLAKLRGKQRLCLVRESGTWLVRLNRDRVSIAGRASAAAESFVRAARGDRATFTPWQELFPIVDQQERWGYMNRKGQVVIQPRFRHAGWFDEGLAPVKLAPDTWRLIDDDGGLKPEPTFGRIDEIIGRFLVIVEESGEDFVRGLATIEGNVVIPSAYDSIDVLSKEEVVLVEREGKHGLFDLSGVFVELLEHDTASEAVLSWSRGELIVSPDGLCCLTADGLRRREPTGSSDAPVPFFDLDEGGFGFANAEGTIVIAPQFEAVRPFAEGLAPVCRAGAWEYIAADGTVAIAGPFEDANTFDDGSALVLTRDAFCLIDSRGTRLGRRWESAGDCRQGLYPVVDDDWIGYIDSRGRIVWSGTYDGLGWG